MPLKRDKGPEAKEAKRLRRQFEKDGGDGYDELSLEALREKTKEKEQRSEPPEDLGKKFRKQLDDLRDDIDIRLTNLQAQLDLKQDKPLPGEST